MNIKNYLKEKKISVHDMSEITTIPYTTLNDIVNERVDLSECKYKTLRKIALFLNVSTDDLVYESEHFQTFRNNLHHDLVKYGMLEVAFMIFKEKKIDYYCFHEDTIKALYLLSLVDYICRLNEIPLCGDYSDLRKKKLKEPYYVGGAKIEDTADIIPEFLSHNIYEGELLDAI